MRNRKLIPIYCLLMAVFWSCSSNPSREKQKFPPVTEKPTVKDELKTQPAFTSQDSMAGKKQSAVRKKTAPGKNIQKSGKAAKIDSPATTVADSSIKKRIVKKKVIRKRRLVKKYNPAPLVCRANPGTMKGNGNRGEYQLDGTVICTYEKLVFNTSKAVWNSRQNTVKFFGGMRVQTNGLILTSTLGGYKKEDGMIWARRDAKVTDTSDTYNFSSDYLSYDVENRLLTLKNNAHLQKIFRDTVHKVIKSEKRTIKKVNKDTLHILAKTILYNDSLRWAKADKQVQIIKGKLQITCGNAYYSEKYETMDFLDGPKANFKHNLMRGDTMKLQLRGEKFESMSFKSKALGDFYENEDSTTAHEEYHVKGDSIFMKMEKEELEYIEVFKKGVAIYILRKFPDQVNEMKGKYLKLDFVKEKIDSASIFGKATSIYFIYDKEEFKGKNEARGDSIALTFDEGKVNNIYIRGRAIGTFFGEESEPVATSDSVKSIEEGQ